MQPSGIGVIRVSGDKALETAGKVFRPFDERRAIDRLDGYCAAYGRLFDSSGDFDDAVALVFRAPHSYTGEDVVEISCHGGRAVMLRLLRALYDAGADPAEAGEFTKRAFLNGKLSLTQAEAVMDVIGAQGALALKNANSVKNGGLYRRITAVKQNLINACAGICVYIDFPEEGVTDMDIGEPLRQLYESERELSSMIDGYRSYSAVRDGIDCVIAGKPNVGKSTLMNMLSDSERSIVTDVAGTTRDVIEQTVELDGLIIRLSDTAGIRSASDEVERLGVEIARRRIENAALVLAVFDLNRPLDSDDRDLIESLRDTPHIIVINKTDLPTQADLEYLNRLGDSVMISAKSGKGREELSELIKKKCGIFGDTASCCPLANERQLHAAKSARSSVIEAIDALNAGVTPDAVTVLIDAAVEKLCELSGESVSESVVSEIFSRFCVGK